MPIPTSRSHSQEFSPELTPESAWAGVRVLAETPYLRHLALLVLLGTTGAALIDYVFKVQAVAALGTGESLLRFFAIYYAARQPGHVTVQTSMSSVASSGWGSHSQVRLPHSRCLQADSERCSPPGSKARFSRAARNRCSAARCSAAAYEVFYTPIPPAEKRAAKSIIDVGFDRIGDAIGGGAIRFILVLAPAAAAFVTIIASTLVCSAAAAFVASRLSKGYIHTLERNLRGRAVEMDLSDVGDLTTRTAMLNTVWRPRGAAGSLKVEPLPVASDKSTKTASGLDPEVQDVIRLRSRDRERVRGVLRREEALDAALIPHLIALLAWDPVADDAIAALRKIAPRHVGALADALLDPYEDFAVRRRIPRVMAVCRSQRAVDSLLLGLDDIRFEVRFQCGRSLAAIVSKEPNLQVDAARIFEVVQKEVAVGRPVWEGRHLLDGLDDNEARSGVDEFIRSRASQSLAHVFTILSLVLPAEPLQIALRGLHADDPNLRGTALEYLESVLPPAVREPLWPFLEDSRDVVGKARARDDILADLVRSNHSIKLNLEEIKRADAHPAKDKENPRGSRRPH